MKKLEIIQTLSILNTMLQSNTLSAENQKAVQEKITTYLRLL